MSRCTLATAGEPTNLKLTVIQNPDGFQADGADMALIQVEVVDREGSAVHWTIESLSLI